MHADGGERVITLFARRLYETGSTWIRVRSHGGGGVDDVRVPIKLEDCSEPVPSYDPECFVHRNGKPL
jgi:hypothetical protein